MEIFYRILEVINWIVIGISIITFAFQFVMILFVPLKEKHFKKSEKKNRIAILICAKNEEEVIERTVKYYKDNINYPKDKYDIFVSADNCSDKTAELARKAGAIVFERTEPDTSKHSHGWNLNFAIKEIQKLDKKYDFLVQFDADNLCNKDFFNYYNDAFNEGVEIARPFEGSTNPTQNLWTSVSFNYYTRDSRIASNFRERLHLDSMLCGPGLMVSFKILDEIEWDALGKSEDVEYTINRLLENKRVHYVADAVVLEDQPSTMKDTWNRLTRMAHGLNKLFWKKGWKLFGHFFKSGKWSNVDLFMQLVMVEFSFLAFMWFVPYYLFYAIIHLINFSGTEWLASYRMLDGTLMTSEASRACFMNLLIMGGIVLGSFIIIYPLQAFLSVFLSRKKLGIKSMKPYMPGILVSPLFMVFYGVSVCVGILTKPKWRKINRNKIEHNIFI